MWWSDCTFESHLAFCQSGDVIFDHKIPNESQVPAPQPVTPEEKEGIQMTRLHPSQIGGAQ